MRVTEVHALDKSPPVLTSVGLGVAIRKRDGAHAVVLAMNSEVYLVGAEALAALAETVQEALAMLVDNADA